MCVRSLRAIKSGEEVLVDYGASYFQNDTRATKTTELVAAARLARQNSAKKRGGGKTKKRARPPASADDAVAPSPTARAKPAQAHSRADASSSLALAAATSVGGVPAGVTLREIPPYRGGVLIAPPPPQPVESEAEPA